MAQSRSCIGIRILWAVAVDLLRLISSAARSHSQLAAENLFLRKQLAYIERQVKARRADDATRITLVALSSLIEWRRILMIVKPDTLIGWHRKGFQLFWRRKSKPRGRPRLPSDLRKLIRNGCGCRRAPFAAIYLPVLGLVVDQVCKTGARLSETTCEASSPAISSLSSPRRFECATCSSSWR
jgi:hypothetical protein